MNLFIYERAVSDMDEFDVNDFRAYIVSREIVIEYTTIYWQEERQFVLRNKSIAEIEEKIERIKTTQQNKLKEMEEYYVREVFPVLFPLAEFNELKSAKECYYCGITEQEIIELADRRKLRKKNLRGWHLEIDRLDSNYEYSRQNCEMCCYWCNNAKTDEFTPEEFRPIGQAIRAIWEGRRQRIERYGSDGSEIRLF